MCYIPIPTKLTDRIDRDELDHYLMMHGQDTLPIY